MKQKHSIKKYTLEQPFNDTNSNITHLNEIRQQLRYTLEQLEQQKLSNQLQSQKRSIAEQQCLMLKEQNHQLRNQLEEIKNQLERLGKKLTKIKEQKNCEKCKNQQEIKNKAQRERQVFMKQRGVLKKQIAELRKAFQSMPCHDQIRISNNVDNLRRELDMKNRTIDDQKKVIKYLDDKLSVFELQKLETLNYVEQVDQKLQELQMQNFIARGAKSGYSPSRKNGSIKNLQRSRSKISPSKY